MQLNLPILDQLADSKNILIAGVGGGFDVFIGLPIYYTLCALGKTVHLANYSFFDLDLASLVGDCEVLLDDLLVGVKAMHTPIIPFAEGYLAQWLLQTRGEAVPIWMFPNTGAAPLMRGYAKLIEHLAIDALVLVDGGVDSLMRGDEMSPGTLIEDAITLTAVQSLDIPVKLLACLGFGTEVEEMLCHHHALENMAALAKEGAFLGSCALTAQMDAFQFYEAAARYVFEQPNHGKSHISTRIIPAVRGEFGNHHMYPDDRHVPIFLSPLMSLYWFFDANAVINRNLILSFLRNTDTKRDAFVLYEMYRNKSQLRPRRKIPIE